MPQRRGRALIDPQPTFVFTPSGHSQFDLCSDSLTVSAKKSRDSRMGAAVTVYERMRSIASPIQRASPNMSIAP